MQKTSRRTALRGIGTFPGTTRGSSSGRRAGRSSDLDQQTVNAPPSASETDASLALSLRAGDRAAQAEIFRRYARLVRAVALAAGVARDEAEDVAQEVFIRAGARAAELKHGEKLAAWLCAMARSAARDHRRAAWRRALRLTAWVSSRPGASPAGEGIGTDEALAAIMSLPEAYRETLMLRLACGLGGPQIAEATGLTEGSVRVNLSKGMAMLRERLKMEVPR